MTEKKLLVFAWTSFSVVSFSLKALVLEFGCWCNFSTRSALLHQKTESFKKLFWLLMSLKEEWSRLETFAGSFFFLWFTFLLLNDKFSVTFFEQTNKYRCFVHFFFVLQNKNQQKKNHCWCKCGGIKQISKQKDQVSKHRFGTRIVSAISHKVPYQKYRYQHLLWYRYQVANIVSYQSKYRIPEDLLLPCSLRIFSWRFFRCSPRLKYYALKC